MSKTDHDEMIRWQGYAREQRSTVNSLFLTYAAALLGIQSSILLSREIARIDWPWLFIVAGIAAILSLAAGGVIVPVRLQEARLIARMARFRVEQKSTSDIDPLSLSTDKLGKWTNGLIKVQVGAFGISALAFLSWIVVSYSAKLSLGAG